MVVGHMHIDSCHHEFLAGPELQEKTEAASTRPEVIPYSKVRSRTHLGTGLNALLRAVGPDHWEC